MSEARELIEEVLGNKCPKCSCYHGDIEDVLKQALAALDTEQEAKERLEDDVIKYNDICVKERREKKRLRKLLQQKGGE